VADLPLTAWSGLAASLGAFNLPLANMRQDGAEVFVLDNACLRNLPQLVEGGVRQVEPTIADRQPTVGIIDHSDALAAELARDLVRLEQKHDLVVLQGQVAGRQWPMKVLQVARLFAEAVIVISQESRQQLIASGV
jgi:hypothetical protein